MNKKILSYKYENNKLLLQFLDWILLSSWEKICMKLCIMIISGVENVTLCRFDYKVALKIKYAMIHSQDFYHCLQMIL